MLVVLLAVSPAEALHLRSAHKKRHADHHKRHAKHHTRHTRIRAFAQARRNNRDRVAPSVPANLTGVGGAQQIDLKWSASTDNVGVQGYRVYRNSVLLTSVPSPTVSFVDTPLVVGMSQTYTVKAYDQAGNLSADSNPVTTMATDPTPPPPPPPGDTTPPSTPTGLTASAGDTKATLSWNAARDDVGVTGYNVLVNGVQKGTSSSTTYTVSSLACGTTYTFGVQAFDQAGNLSSLTTLSVTTASCAPPPPPATVCSKTLAAGGGLSSFVNSLKPGDVGCLHGGTYTEGTIVTWRASGTSTAPVTVTEYPGEKAEIVGTTFNLGGSYQVMRDLTVRDVTCTDCDGITVDGTGNRAEHNEVYNVWRQGILLHTDASNAAITRNYVHDTGQAGSNQYHGIYVQGDGHVVTNNLFANMRGGYGIHVYPSSSKVVVAQNTVVNSETRSGILIDTTGGNIVVVNNIVVGNTDYGVLNRQCSLGGCVVDHNLAWNNGLGAMGGSATNAIQADPLFIDGAYHVASNSPAVNAARSDYSYSSALDGISRPQGGAPDIGAYER